MASLVTDQESEIKSWLKIVLKDKNVDNFLVTVVGSSEKGYGYVGDIVFVSLTPTDGYQSESYNLVLKCSKRSEALKEQAGVELSYLNEIYIYDTVLPAFTQFQSDRGITEPFTSVPKCYGTLNVEDMKIIVLENLRKLGYGLWDKRRPLMRKHIDMIMGEYAKFHAVSIAMRDQNPEKYEELRQGLSDVMGDIANDSDTQTYVENSIEEVCDLLKDDLDENVISEWRKLKEKFIDTFTEMLEGKNGVEVILHGDCWSNNFLFKHPNDNKEQPTDVALLDWQLSISSNPILDVSYFLFATISEEDIIDMDTILRHYHDSLGIFVKQLGSDLELIYPIEQLFKDWRKYSIYGIAMATMAFKFCATSEDEVVDTAESAEKGENFLKAFDYEVRDKICFKNRSKHVVEYVVANSLI